MKKSTNNQNRGKLSAKTVIVIALVMAAFLALGVFIGSFAMRKNSNGTLILSVNPRIRIDYDENGLVTAVSGKNTDGIEIVNNAGALEGLECAEAVQILIREIHSAGYFIDEIDGERRNVYLKVEKGSFVPSKSFVEDISLGVERTVEELNVNTDLITIESGDYGNPLLGQGKYISLDKAKEIAVSHAQVSAESARFTEVDLDVERKYAVYELEFVSEGVKYEYEIDAESGKVVKYEAEGKKNLGQQTVDPNAELISRERAIEVSLSHANADQSAVTALKCKLDRDDGTQVYEIEFVYENAEYDYEIHAQTAEVLSHEREQRRSNTQVPADGEQNNENSGSAASENSQMTENKENAQNTANVPNNPSQSAENTLIGKEKAIEIALSHAGVTPRYVECELDREHGRTVYVVEFEVDGYEYEYEIDATTAEIVKSHKEFDD